MYRTFYVRLSHKASPNVQDEWKSENEPPQGAFFSFRGQRGAFLFIAKKKSSLKTSLFHLVFTDVNTSFVHAVNSPLFSEQQNRFRADLFRKTD